jgi:hypothetical protein
VAVPSVRDANADEAEVVILGLIRRVDAAGEMLRDGPDRAVALDLRTIIESDYRSLSAAERARLETLVDRVEKVADERRDWSASLEKVREEAREHFVPLRSLHESLYSEMAKWRVTALLTVNSGGVVAVLNSASVSIPDKRVAMILMLIGAMLSLFAGTALGAHGHLGVIFAHSSPSSTPKISSLEARIEGMNRGLRAYWRAGVMSELLIFGSLFCFVAAVITIIF